MSVAYRIEAAFLERNEEGMLVPIPGSGTFSLFLNLDIISHPEQASGSKGS